ncbi:MAG: hypothetical protein HYV60_20495 [Planctomycetia bacterium]|nr:hypothetical protein [Planctomycetia bacterium]
MIQTEFSIPAVRGTQAGHDFYTAMCPIRLLSRLFPVGVDRTTTESHQSFRKASADRVRAIARDIVTHYDDYHLAAVTISVEDEVRFVAAGRSCPPSVWSATSPAGMPVTGRRQRCHADPRRPRRVATRSNLQRRETT